MILWVLFHSHHRAIGNQRRATKNYRNHGAIWQIVSFSNFEGKWTRPGRPAFPKNCTICMAAWLSLQMAKSLGRRIDGKNQKSKNQLKTFTPGNPIFPALDSWRGMVWQYMAIECLYTATISFELLQCGRKLNNRGPLVKRLRQK